jgi:competence protein ComEA
MKKSLRIVALSLAFVVAFLASSGAAFAAAAPAPAGKVNINTATAEQLAAVPGIGDTLAARIVEQRGKAGSFKSVQDLLTVKGIGEKSLAKLEPQLTVGDSKPASK